MSRATARPKRAAEDYARTHHEDQSDDMGPSSSKKPRFDIRNPSALAPDALEEDAVLEADEIGKRGQQVRRNAVNIDGYDSDSENEGFNGRAAKAKHASKLEEENDMFADLDDDFKDGDDDEGDEKRKGDGRKKAVRFLEEDEIEGQVQSSKSGGHVSADFTLNGRANGKSIDEEVECSSDSEVDEETRAAVGHEVDEELGAGAKKSHAPKLDAFNMRNEQEEGRFDEQGNFVRKAADPDAVHDMWLEGISKKDMKKAKEAAEKRDQERREQDVANDARLNRDLLATLITLLDRGETSLEALARLGKSIEKKKPKWQNKHKKNRKKAEDDDNDEQRSSNGGSRNHNGDGPHHDTEMHDTEPMTVSDKNKAAVESLTEAADLLLTRGQPEIYDAERELLIRQYRRETGEEWRDPEPVADDDFNDDDGTGGIGGPQSTRTVTGKMWEYRWSDGRDGGEAHGPYDGTTMVQWNEAGYFGDGVEFRRIGGDGSEWNWVVDFV